MTEREKNMKKYLSAIERRLNLPREVKQRVMSDLASAVEARREAGLSDDQIREELGEPKKAAAELNEQMKEYAYRKSPWRFLCLLAAVWGVLDLLSSLAAVLLYLMVGDPVGAVSDAASLGIIGGADGPTAIFVSYAVPSYTQILLPLVLVILGIWGYRRLKKCKQKQ